MTIASMVLTIPSQFQTRLTLHFTLSQVDLSGGDKTSYALDIRHSAVQYFNDLEKA